MQPYQRFLELWAEIVDLDRAASVLSWDQETQMPVRGNAARGKLMATLAGVHHERLSSDELLEALQKAEGEVEPGSLEEAQLRQGRREIDKVRRVPQRLTMALAEATTAGHESWRRAREASDFALFRDDLARIFDLKREEAELLADGGNPYDALLDRFEPGMTEAELVPLFQKLREHLGPIVQAVADSGVVVDESPARGAFPEEAQLALGRDVAKAIGFDFERGRIDLAPHPFCTGFHPTDVRITWRFLPYDFRSALFGILHEAGHGTYEQGLPLELQRTPIGGAVSLGVHESQSRLWENLVGRSRAFWEWCLPVLQQHLPGTEAVTVDTLWPALNTIRPSLIRVEADQGTYDLHIAVRFEVERALFAGEIALDELPEAWDTKVEELLGIRADDVADGVLQDIHWSFGGFGYFPTYTLGNLINAQLFEAAEAALGDQAESFRRGEFAPLASWLRENVHAHGSRYPAAELVERATGRPLSSDAFLKRRAEAAEAVYGVRL